MQSDQSDVKLRSNVPSVPTARTVAPRTTFLKLNYFDRRVALIVLMLLLLTGFVIVLGDRVGVTLQRVAPLGVARSTSSIIMQFSEGMNRVTVPPNVKVVQVPPDKMDSTLTDSDVLSTVAGTVSWSGTTFNFRPNAPLKPGAAYQVILNPGAVSDSGRKVIAEYHYSFTVRTPRVAYLAPANGVPINLWVADPTVPGSAHQVTNSPSGIYDYGVSPDGSKIAFTEKNTSTGTMDIKLLDVDSGGIEQLTNCADSECKTPVWRPDGQLIAYERIDLNSSMSNQLGASPTRIWIIDLSSKPATTRPLFDDSQILGYGVRWSADGTRISMFDYSSQGILVHDFRDSTNEVIPSKYGDPGELSPDGTKLIYPEVTMANNEATSYLQVVDLVTKTIQHLTTPEDPIDDNVAIWSPDGKFLIVGRRYLDDRMTRGRQLYKVNPADGTSEPLVVDPDYQNGLFVLD
ncbi:MAG: Ig-like domain-containing protein, partial [Chloroflexota bacterium]